MRRAPSSRSWGLHLVAGGVATAVAFVPTWLPEDCLAAGRPDRLHVLVRDRDLHLHLRDRCRGDGLRGRPVPGCDEDDFEDGPPIHGHTGLEIAWTIIPFILVTAIAIVSAIVLPGTTPRRKDTLRVDVTAQQFEFTFSYPDAGTSPARCSCCRRAVPSSSTCARSTSSTRSSCRSSRSKEDIVPGLVTQLHVTPTRLGTFPLECTELCGLGHSLMRSQAIVMEPAAFDAWLKQQEKSAAPPASTTTSTTSTTTSTTSTSPSAAGLTVFNANGCSSCHTLSAANATGKIGPDLDNLVSYAKKAKRPLEAFVRQSIVDPNAYIQPGYPKDIMPANFGQSLTKSELDALVRFLVQSAQKSGNK